MLIYALARLKEGSTWASLVGIVTAASTMTAPWNWLTATLGVPGVLLKDYGADK